MNCYSDIDIKFYCLNPINPDYTYIWTDDYDGNNFLYCQNDKSINPLHREGGPAVEDSWDAPIPRTYWFYNGKSHREDGPADEFTGGETRWFYHGEQINCKDNEEFLKIIKMKAFL